MMTSEKARSSLATFQTAFGPIKKTTSSSQIILRSLQQDIAGGPYNKAAHRRALLPLLNGRSEKAIEFKHQNISAVLKGLGETWIPGYKPTFHFQMSLADGIVAEVSHCPDLPLSPFISFHAFDLGSAECIEAVDECYADLDLGSLTIRIA